MKSTHIDPATDIDMKPTHIDPDASDLANKLKIQTRINHQLLEKSVIDIIKKISSEDDYIRLLQIFYGYFGGLEEAIQPFIPLIKLDDLAARRKSALLRNDILYLNGQLPALASNENLPNLQYAIQAFGALYVMEGSTLGGVHIAAMIQKRISVSNQCLSFFKGYGSDTMTMWTAFTSLLNALTASEQELSQIIIAADETFVRFSQWIDQNN